MNPEWREIPWERALTAASPNVANTLGKALAGTDLGLEEGVTLAAGIEARVAIEGAARFAPLLDYATSRRTADPAALAPVDRPLPSHGFPLSCCRSHSRSCPNGRSNDGASFMALIVFCISVASPSPPGSHCVR